ncbi:MAG: hypothetical protein WBM39_10245 [Parasphingorhabdus sp.]
MTHIGKKFGLRTRRSFGDIQRAHNLPFFIYQYLGFAFDFRFDIRFAPSMEYYKRRKGQNKSQSANHDEHRFLCSHTAFEFGCAMPGYRPSLPHDRQGFGHRILRRPRPPGNFFAGENQLGFICGNAVMYGDVEIAALTCGQVLHEPGRYKWCVYPTSKCGTLPRHGGQRTTGVVNRSKQEKSCAFCFILYKKYPLRNRRLADIPCPVGSRATVCLETNIKADSFFVNRNWLDIGN